MSLNCDIDHFLKEQEWLVWVLAPYLKTEDPNLQYYYDFSQSIQEYSAVFAELGLNWKWQSISLDNYKDTLINIQKSSYPKTPLILNLCDGDEENGVPGLSVVKLLDELNLIYTGSDQYFYQITTSKIPMKICFDQYQVPTPSWLIIDPDTANFNQIISVLNPPFIVKPAISAGSLGIGLNAVIDDSDSFINYLNQFKEGYNGWDLVKGGLFVEEFIDGEEYTTFIVGNYNQETESIIYNPVERVFDESLPPKEKFLSFERLWEIYENEAPLLDNKALWNYGIPQLSLIEEIKQISWKAYHSVKGTGYGRIDLRRNKSNGQLLVLEVNAQCGLSDDENYTSIGAILRLGQTHFSMLIKQILFNAYQKHFNKISPIHLNSENIIINEKN